VGEDTLLNPRLKSIAEFLDGNHHFIIPSYQRGYRWEKRQILDLLEDIYEFQDEIKEKKENGKYPTGEFYCLQPIVVLKKGNEWEVIDGQQRLTTIFILLSALKKTIEEDTDLPIKLSDIFSIAYETRDKEERSSRRFLEKITEIEKEDKNNIDFFRMSEAYLIIKEWLNDFKKKNRIRTDFCYTLLKKDIKDDLDRANNVRFIWYELDSKEDEPNEVFSKYNQGKIDLTNAELIKASFYLADSSMDDREKNKYQLKTGYEWDDMEKTLQKNDFWKFINPDKKNSNKSYANHIEFIFELVANKYLDKTNLELNKNIDTLWSFYVFDELITKNTAIYDTEKYTNAKDFLWDEVKTYYRTFIEWYDNNEYYHLVGFLLQTGGKIEIIKNLAENNEKDKFEEELRHLIQNHFGDIDLEQLGYDDKSETPKGLLLLFNVITTMKSQYNRFPFDKFTEEKWSLEHIHAQQSEELKNDKQRKILLEDQKKYFSKNNEKDLKELLIKIDKLLEMKEINKDEFKMVQDEIFSKYSDTDIIHSIKNLALLRGEDNSRLNNNIFPIKREMIKELDEKGSFIPICTKNVFLKYYSKNVDQNVKWDIQDMIAYLDEIKDVLKNYIRIKENDKKI